MDSSPPRTGVVRRLLAAATAGLAISVLFAGCAAPAEAEKPASAESITVTDQRGVEVTFDQPVERVATIVMPAASLFVAVDGGIDHLVGMNPSSKEALLDGVLGNFYPDAADIADDVSGTDFVPNVESIIALDPDVVIQWGDRDASFTAPLEQAGIPVIGLTYGTQADLEEWVRIFGTILGKEDRAEKIIDNFNTDADLVTDVVAAAATSSEAAQKPGIMSLSSAAGSYSTSNSASYTNHYIELAGGRNVSADLQNTAGVSIEQIIQWDPDIILLGNFDDLTPQEIYDDPLWQDIAAVQAKQVYKMPLGGYRWDPPNQESGLAFRWVAQLTHPELDFGDLRAEMVTEYTFLYGVAPTETQLDKILHTDLNAGSAHYDAFSQ